MFKLEILLPLWIIYFTVAKSSILFFIYKNLYLFSCLSRHVTCFGLLHELTMNSYNNNYKQNTNKYIIRYSIYQRWAFTRHLVKTLQLSY